ncbi:kinesin-like protein KIF11 [Diabrotica undecimpunctata]|uniref:kinesin-like protein KIF11 n=1 Tax=Diabrotica undecimpunctata TaxID=50387 RepID=UPI003B638D4D
MSSMTQKRKTPQHLQNVKVVVRIRPLSKQEEDQNVKSIVTTHTHRELVLKEKKYSFDRVFKSTATQIELYLHVIAPLIQDVVEGYNCTVFAYGQTGTGKTYTMTGEKCNLVGNWREDVHAGVIPRAAFHIFHELDKLSNVDVNVKVSYIELYNEEIRDLLSDNENILQMYSDNKGSVTIHGLTEISVHNGEGICKYLQRGIVKRQIAPTLMNHQSSRSHTVFTISINTRETTICGDDILKAGKINLVDLAGSENIAKSGCKEIRAVELANINKSLLTLGRVIHALADKSNKHVPYRDSKLTRILQDSLGGHTKTAIIATVSPALNSHEETSSTLEYASRARDIKNTPIVNEKMTKNEVIEGLVKEIDRLQKDLDAARSGTGFYVNKENFDKMIDAIVAVTGEHITADELMDRKAERIKNLEDRLYSRMREFDETVEQCKKHKEELENAMAMIKEQDDILEQEKFLSKWFEDQTSEKLEEAHKLLSATKTLHSEKEILLAKLEHQFNINVSNQKLTHTAVSNAVHMLDEFGSQECKRIKLSEKKGKEQVEKNVLELQRNFHDTSNSIKKLPEDCETRIREYKNGFSIKKTISVKSKYYLDTMREKTRVVEDVLSQYAQQLDLVKSEIPKMEQSYRQNSIKYFDEAMTLIKSSDNITSGINSEQTRRYYENLNQTEKTLTERIKENESLIALLQKRIEEDSIILKRIQVDRGNVANAEEKTRECILERANNLEKLAKEALEGLQSCYQLPNLIAIQDAKMQELHAVIQEFEDKLNEISSVLNKKHEEITEHTIETFNTSISNTCKSIEEAMDEKINNLLNSVDMVIGKTDTVESFTKFICHMKEVLIQQILEKNVKAKHVGDTPVRQSTSYPLRIKEVAPREALIEKFKQSTAQKIEEGDIDY